MKKIILYVFLISIVTGFFSCEKEIDIAIPDRERKIIINSLFTSNQTLTVNVTKSLSIMDPVDIIFLNDATIKLYENNTFIENLQLISNGNYISSHNLINAKNYRVEVERNGVTASAINYIPEPIEIIDIDTNSIRLFEYDYLQCIINFQDNPHEENYYMFSLDNFKTDIYEYYDNGILISDTVEYNNSYFQSDDIIIENWLYINDQSYILFADHLISGKSYGLNIRVEHSNSYYYPDMSFNDTDSSYIHFNLFSVTEEYYKYFKTFSMHRDSRENPFAEPVQVFSNVENGLGVFAGFSSNSDSILFISKPFIGK